VTGEFASIEGDEVLLRQAFGNLLRNASEACAASDRPPLIEVSGTKAQDGTLRIVVADNGQGIDPARLDRIFQPFVTTKPQGTGLGLSVVQKIVVTHNGRVAASNRTDGGAAFEVVLPTEQPSHPG
jgi:signal transduction histidine kinase